VIAETAKNCMADAIWAAFSFGNAALSRPMGTMDRAMVEILFFAQLARRPLQAMARRWWCRAFTAPRADSGAAGNARNREPRF
jgi:hypothetical protein